MLSSPSSCLRLEPVDDLTAGGLPHARMGADMAKHFVEMPDAPWLAHDPWMQMEHHQAAGGGAVGVKTIEPLAPQQIDLVDGAAAVEVDVIVVEIGMYAKRVQLPGLGGHLVGLLVVAPVT